MLLALAMIFLFGGSFVAVHKPLNPKAAAVVLGIGVVFLLLAIASGWPKWIGVLGLLVLIGFVLLRRIRS
jgi:MYXO-CTERM domain-containing protein